MDSVTSLSLAKESGQTSSSLDLAIKVANLRPLRAASAVGLYDLNEFLVFRADLRSPRGCAGAGTSAFDNQQTLLFFSVPHDLSQVVPNVVSSSFPLG